MKFFSIKALGASLLSVGLVLAGVVNPAQAVSPATTITSTPASSTVLSGGTTPAFSIETDGSPDVMTQATKFKLVFIDGGGHAFSPKDSCVMATIPTWSDCGITGVTRAGAPVTEQNAPVSLAYMGGRHYLTISYASYLAGDSVGISFSPGAFNVGTEFSGSTNFNAQMYFYTASDNSSGSISATNGTFVRVLPPALYPNSISLTGTTASPPSGNNAFSTQGLVGNVTYSTTLTIPGYDFSASTGRYTRNSNAVTATSSSGTITATGATSGTATATVSVNITQSVATITIGMSSSYTQNGQVGSSISFPMVSATGFGGQVTYSASSTPAGLTFNTATGSFSGTPTSTSSAIVTITGTGSTSGTATATVTFNIVSGGGGGGGGIPSSISFTATGSLVDSSSSAITNLPASSSIPAFTATASNPTNNATYSMVGVIFSRSSGGTEYFSVANAVNTMTQSLPPTPWSPGTCGIAAISLGGVTQTGSSGLFCQKQTWTFNSTNAYAVRIYLNGETSAPVSVSVADGVFTSGTAGNYTFRLALSSAPVNGSYFSGTAPVAITVGGSVVNAPSTPAPSAALSMGVSAGQLITGASVGISASGLQASAPYSVIVQSTPQTLATGNAVNGAVNSSVTIPAGLEPGWHTLTFSSTAADGSPVVSKLYFKVAGDGTLLSTTSVIPAELAYTGASSSTSPSLLGGLAVAFIAFGSFLIARRKRSN